MLSGQWWWSSGQRARLLLWRSEFESRWSLQFLFCKLFEQNENKKKEAGDGPFKKITTILWNKVFWLDVPSHMTSFNLRSVEKAIKEWPRIKVKVNDQGSRSRNDQGPRIKVKEWPRIKIKVKEWLRIKAKEWPRIKIKVKEWPRIKVKVNDQGSRDDQGPGYQGMTFVVKVNQASYFLPFTASSVCP